MKYSHALKDGVSKGKKLLKTEQKFRLGGIPECMFLAILFSIGYLGLAVMFPESHLPLIHSNISEVFATFFLLVPSMFIRLSALELLWFERDLTWSGRQKKTNGGAIPSKSKDLGILANFI